MAFRVGLYGLRADFTSSPGATAYTGATVSFTDNSNQANSWLWDFGDGSGSTAQNPNKIYLTPGTYSVKLTAYRDNQISGVDYRPNLLTIESLYDPDAEAFINASGISGLNAAAIDQLVIDLKNYNLWDKMQAVYPFVGSTAGDHKWNLIDPQDTDAAKRITFNGTWTHDSGGADPNGVSGTWGNTYINGLESFWSGITGATGAHISINITQNDGSAGYDLGIFDGSTEWMSIASFGNDTAYGLLGTFAGNWITYSNTDTIGFYTVSHVGETLTDYKDAVNKGSDTRTFAIPNASDTFIAIAGSGRSGSSATDPSSRKMNFVTIGYGLTAGDVTNLNTAMDDYNTTLGR